MLAVSIFGGFAAYGLACTYCQEFALAAGVPAPAALDPPPPPCAASPSHTQAPSFLLFPSACALQVIFNPLCPGLNWCLFSACPPQRSGHGQVPGFIHSVQSTRDCMCLLPMSRLSPPHLWTPGPLPPGPTIPSTPTPPSSKTLQVPIILPLCTTWLLSYAQPLAARLFFHEKGERMPMLPRNVHGTCTL